MLAVRVAILAALAAALVAPAASASDVRMANGTLPGSQRIAVLAGPGEANDVTFFTEGFSFVVVDRAGVVAGAGCLQASPTRADCQPAGGLGGPPPDLVAQLGDGNDVFASPAERITLGYTAEIHGGPGDDSLSFASDAPTAPHLHGDDGNDTVVGGRSADWLLGGPGNDRLSAASADENDQVWCGAGADAALGDYGDTVDADCETRAFVGRKPVSCVVPRLKKKTLRAAKKALSRAHCRLGRVQRKYSRTVKRGRVVSQTVKAGRRRAEGATVSVVVSRGKKKPRRQRSR